MLYLCLLAISICDLKGLLIYFMCTSFNEGFHWSSQGSKRPGYRHLYRKSINTGIISIELRLNLHWPLRYLLKKENLYPDNVLWHSRDPMKQHQAEWRWCPSRWKTVLQNLPGKNPRCLLYRNEIKNTKSLEKYALNLLIFFFSILNPDRWGRRRKALIRRSVWA